MATEPRKVKVGDIIADRSESTEERAWQAVAKLTLALEAIATGLDADTGVNTTTYAAAVALILTPKVIE